jgi:hypothetical protein
VNPRWVQLQRRVVDADPEGQGEPSGLGVQAGQQILVEPAVDARVAVGPGRRRSAVLCPPGFGSPVPNPSVTPRVASRVLRRA